MLPTTVNAGARRQVYKPGVGVYLRRIIKPKQMDLE
jgi:hypothetical protein